MSSKVFVVLIVICCASTGFSNPAPHRFNRRRHFRSSSDEDSSMPLTSTIPTGASTSPTVPTTISTTNVTPTLETSIPSVVTPSPFDIFLANIRKLFEQFQAAQQSGI